MRAPTSTRPAAVLGAVAGLFVAVVGVVGVLPVAGVIVTPTPSPERPTHDVGGAGLVLSVPPGWSPTSAATRLSYRLPGGGRVALRAPVLLDRGACDADPDSARAFLGFVRGGHPGHTGHTGLVRRWTAGVRGRAGVVVARTSGTGPRSVRSDVVLRLPEDGPCAAPSAVLTVLTVTAGPARGSGVVLVRDAGVAGALGDAARSEEHHV